jgi:hypothetical protein
MSAREEPKDGSSATTSSEGVSPDGTADMSDEYFRPTLAEGGEAAMNALVKKAKTTPGSVFEPQTLRALAQLAKTEFPTWINLRARLKSEARDVPITELDKRVIPDDGEATDGDGRLSGAPLKYDEIEPWDEPVDGAQLLTELSSEIGAYVIMDPPQRHAVALWVVFTHAHDFFLCAALLIILSPTKRCGKTRLQEILAKLTPRSQTMSGVSAAALARLIEEHRPTVFIDEYDATAKGSREVAESLRGQLNSSFNRNSAHVLKCVPLPGGGWDVWKFSTWASTCIAGIGRVPDTVADRSVIIRLARKLRAQSVKRLSARDGGELLLLARRIARFVRDNEQRLRRDEPDVPKELNDRARDAWEPLLAIADLAGGEWPQLARAAALKLSGDGLGDSRNDDVDIILLADIRDVFATVGARVSSDTLTDHLVGLESGPWADWKNGKPLTKNQLSRRLREKFRIVSDALDFGGAEGRKRGYRLADFADAFARYLPPEAESTRELVQAIESTDEDAPIKLVMTASGHEFENGQNTSKLNKFHEFTSLRPARSSASPHSRLPPTAPSVSNDGEDASSDEDGARTAWSGRIVL